MSRRRSSRHAGLLAALGDLVLPTRCGGCDLPGSSWCRVCRAVLADGPAPHRWSPTPAPAGLPVVWTVLPYRGPVRACLVNWKDNGRRDLVRVLVPPLTEVLLAALVACPEGLPVVLVPTPSARSNIRRRGDRPLHDLTRRALETVPTADRPPVMSALTLGRPVADQAGLDSAGRAQNLAGAMVVPPRALERVRGACCIVVDDVITTGATLAEAARALSAAGAADVLAATVAATRRQRTAAVGTGAIRTAQSVPNGCHQGAPERAGGGSHGIPDGGVSKVALLTGPTRPPRLTFLREPG